MNLNEWCLRALLSRFWLEALMRKEIRCLKMERKLTKVVDGTEITETGKMCSCGTDVANNLCSWECLDTCGDGGSLVPTKTG